MKYKQFYEAYPWGGFDATKDDFSSTNSPDDTSSDPKDIKVTDTRISNVVEKKDGPCWSGYEMIGWKMKDGKKVPNCVPIKKNEGQNSPAYKGPVGYDDGCDCYPNDPDENIDELYEGEYCPRCLGEYIIRKKLGPLEEAEYQGRKVALGKPMRGDVKKFKVFVKDPKTGNVKKVNFGDKTMRIKKSNPNRRRSFRARHHCDTNPGPRTKARYWSCRKW